MQTIRGAAVAGMATEVGSLEPDKRADIVIRRADNVECSPGVNPIHQLALTAEAGSVETVIVDGKIVFAGGASTRVDEKVVMAEARASVQRRLRRLGLSSGAAWQVSESA